MTFAEQHYLIALAAVPLIAILAALMKLRRRGIFARMGEPPLIAALAEGYSPERRALKLTLALLAVACAVLSAARPQVGWETTRGSAEGIDLIVALDVSASMLAEDVKPNRIERAKSELAALISEMSGSRIGIVAFAGSAVAVCPLTADSRAAMMFLDAIQWGVVEEPGTDLGEAIDRALGSFDRAEDRTRAVLIVSDGEDHEGRAAEAAKRAVEAGVPIYCVGMGGESGVPIPTSPSGVEGGLRRDSDGRVVLTRLEAEVLREIAVTANGALHVQGPGGVGLKGLIEDIEELPQKERPTSYTHKGERFHLFAMAAVFLLAVDWAVRDRRRPGPPLWAPVLACSILMAATPAFASPADDAVKLYNEGDYLGALARFKEALEKEPSPSLYYDAGNALYKLDKYDAAARHYAGSAAEAEPSLGARARYNLGNSLLRAGDAKGAIEQYIESLKLNPGDEDAKHNLEVALRMLQNSRQPPRGARGKDEEESSEDRSGGQGPAGGKERVGEQRRDAPGGGTGQGEDRGSMEEPSLSGEAAPGARFTKEEAERLLEALAGDERDLLSKRMKSRVKRKGVEKDW